VLEDATGVIKTESAIATALSRTNRDASAVIAAEYEQLAHQIEAVRFGQDLGGLVTSRGEDDLTAAL
jgi:hypothetical protein